MTTWRLPESRRQPWRLPERVERRPAAAAVHRAPVAGREIRVRPRMVVCTRTFDVANVRDRTVMTIVAGRDYVDIDHELARKFPQNFGVPEGTVRDFRGRRMRVLARAA